MLDQYGRRIDYMRISVTDRCNLRCRYCMPEAVESVSHCDVLRYEEILRICRAAIEIGITKFKITGGEPLVREECTEFIAHLKTHMALIRSRLQQTVCCLPISSRRLPLPALTE